jgi:MFS family permease
MSISIAVGSVPGVIEAFGVSETQALGIISVSAAGFLLAPIIGVSVTEVYGRRTILLPFSLLAILFTIACGVVKNYAGLLVVRFLAALAISPVIVVGAGTLNDLWNPHAGTLETSVFGLYASAQIWATEVGPLAGAGVVNSTHSWRWPFWLSTILLGVCALILWPSPETFAPRLNRIRGQKRTSNIGKILGVSFLRVCHMLVMELIIWPTALMVGVYQGTMYFFYGAFALLFTQVFGFSLYQSVLPFSAVLVGSCIGLVVFAAIDRFIYRPRVELSIAAGEEIKVEGRLISAIIGAPLMPASLFW